MLVTGHWVGGLWYPQLIYKGGSPRGIAQGGSQKHIHQGGPQGNTQGYPEDNTPPDPTASTPPDQTAPRRRRLHEPPTTQHTTTPLPSVVPLGRSSRGLNVGTYGAVWSPVRVPTLPVDLWSDGGGTITQNDDVDLSLDHPVLRPLVRPGPP